MKEWQVTLGGAPVMFVAGIGMFLWANSIEIPATFLGYNEYILVSNQYFSTSQAGALYRIRRRITNLHSPNLPAREEARIQVTRHVDSKPRESLNIYCIICP